MLKRVRAAEHYSGFESSGNARTTNAHHIARSGDSDTDEDYAIVLSAAISYIDCSIPYLQEDGDGPDTDLAVQDPQLKLFSESAKVDGSSYVVEWQESNGTTHIVKFEDPNITDPIQMCTNDENMTAFDNSWKNILDGVQWGKSSRVGKSTMVKPLNRVSGGKRNCNFTVPKSIPYVYDSYSRWLSNLRMDGKRIVHTSKTGEVVRYEEDESSSYGHIERGVSDRNVIATEDVMHSIHLSNLRMDGKSIVHTSKTGEVVRYGEDEASSSYPLARKIIDRNVIPIKDDDIYSIFLSRIRMDGEDKVYTSKTGEVVRYMGGQESSSDSVSDINVIMDIDPREGQDRTPDPATESDTIGDGSDFKEKLFSILKRPYSREEYVDLLQKASYQRKRERKSGELSRSRKHKSYLDLHPALREKINLVRHNRCKVLNLLRGFFYWLENLPHEIDFVPWLEPSCLEVMPGEVD